MLNSDVIYLFFKLMILTGVTQQRLRLSKILMDLKKCLLIKSIIKEQRKKIRIPEHFIAVLNSLKNTFDLMICSVLTILI